MCLLKEVAEETISPGDDDNIASEALRRTCERFLAYETDIKFAEAVEQSRAQPSLESFKVVERQAADLSAEVSALHCVISSHMLLFCCCRCSVVLLLSLNARLGFLMLC